ncbi:MAG: AIDA repeat-containing protein, partial [Desulfovibrionaceae bacterium]|nr:AIDA repeat-containing protein [Desulfovibrionaceae bacterium]
QKVGGNVIIDVIGGDSATKVTGSNAKGKFSYSNGVAKNFILYSGGWQYVSSGGVASATTINSGGWQNVNGGVASATTISSGGRQNVNGGVANATDICQGGEQRVSEGGVASDTTISSGGLQDVNGGVALDTTQKVGGNVIIDVIGGDSATKVTGSNAKGKFSYSNGVAKNFILYSGGSQVVSFGGVANATTVNKNGTLAILSSGTAVAVVLKEGGSLVISSGGIAGTKSIASGASITLDSGGTLNLSAGNTLYGKNTFSDATITGGTTKKRVALAKNASLTLGTNMVMNDLHLKVANAVISATGAGNTLGSLQTNKSTSVSYDISNVAAEDETYMLTLSTKNTQKLGSFSVNVKKSQGVGTYELSKNIAQQKNTAYTVKLAGKKQGTAKLDGLGLIKGTVIYTIDTGSANTVNFTVAKTGKMLKGTTKAEKLTGTANWDVFYGGKGNDTITGKNGHDVAVYDKTAWGKDVIAKTSGAMTLLFKDLKADNIIQKTSGSTLTITKKSDAKQKITVKGWSDETHNVVFASSMTAFNKFLKAASPTTAQTTAARNEAFKKAGLASA